jgi:DNA invertase Pin-like site-specific DNA recombinase
MPPQLDTCVLRGSSARLCRVDQTVSMVEALDCPTCAAPAGSACRTRSGNTAIKYHTARLLLVPALRGVVEVDVPAGRGPGRPWQATPSVAVRIGYAYCSLTEDLAEQVDALRAAGCTRIVTEQTGVRVKARPELDTVLADARVLTVHELKRAARNTAELITLSATLRAGRITLELLTGPLAGTHPPDSAFHAVLAAAAGLDRAHAREKTLAGQQEAALKGHPGGRPKVFDDDMLAAARALYDNGMPVPDIARELVITTGKNAGGHPSVASVYRALAEPTPILQESR